VELNQYEAIGDDEDDLDGLLTFGPLPLPKHELKSF